MTANHQPLLGHSKNDHGEAELLATHIEAVARKAATFAAPFGASEEARLAGVLHDIGKMHPDFQTRLRGKSHRVDHCSQGAWHSLHLWREHGAVAAACIWGHHQGLQCFTKNDLEALEPGRRKEACEAARIRFGSVDLPRVREWLQDHAIRLPDNDITIDNDEEGLVELTLSVATGNAGKAEIAEFFRSHAQ